MNRRKYINQVLKKRAKQKNEKENPKAKPVYVSKADRDSKSQKNIGASVVGDIEQNTQFPIL